MLRNCCLHLRKAGRCRAKRRYTHTCDVGDEIDCGSVDSGCNYTAVKSVETRKIDVSSLGPPVRVTFLSWRDPPIFLSIRWPYSATELYRLSDRRLSTKSLSTFADRGVPCGQLGGSLRPYCRFSRPEPLLFLPSSPSVVLTRLSGPRSRPTTSQKVW
jgi:hypothetical protein